MCVCVGVGVDVGVARWAETRRVRDRAGKQGWLTGNAKAAVARQAR